MARTDLPERIRYELRGNRCQDQARSRATFCLRDLSALATISDQASSLRVKNTMACMELCFLGLHLYVSLCYLKCGLHGAFWAPGASADFTYVQLPDMVEHDAVYGDRLGLRLPQDAIIPSPFPPMATLFALVTIVKISVYNYEPALINR